MCLFLDLDSATLSEIAVLFRVVAERITSAIQPRQWRQHPAVGETHGNDYFDPPKPRQGRQQSAKSHAAAPAGALKPRQFTSVG